MAGPGFDASPILTPLKWSWLGCASRGPWRLGKAGPAPSPVLWPLPLPPLLGFSVPTFSASEPLRAALHGGQAQPIPFPVVSPTLASREDRVAAPWVTRPAADLPAGGARRVSGRRALAPPPSQVSREPRLQSFLATCGNGGRAFRSWASVGLAHVAPELIAHKILGTYAQGTWFARGKLGSHAPGKARLPQPSRATHWNHRAAPPALGDGGSSFSPGPDPPAPSWAALDRSQLPLSPRRSLMFWSAVVSLSAARPCLRSLKSRCFSVRGWACRASWRSLAFEPLPLRSSRSLGPVSCPCHFREGEPEASSAPASYACQRSPDRRGLRSSPLLPLAARLLRVVGSGLPPARLHSVLHVLAPGPAGLGSVRPAPLDIAATAAATATAAAAPVPVGARSASPGTGPLLSPGTDSLAAVRGVAAAAAWGLPRGGSAVTRVPGSSVGGA